MDTLGLVLVGLAILVGWQTRIAAVALAAAAPAQAQRTRLTVSPAPSDGRRCRNTP